MARWRDAAAAAAAAAIAEVNELFDQIAWGVCLQRSSWCCRCFWCCKCCWCCSLVVMLLPLWPQSVAVTSSTSEFCKKFVKFRHSCGDEWNVSLLNFKLSLKIKVLFLDQITSAMWAKLFHVQRLEPRTGGLEARLIPLCHTYFFVVQACY